MLAEINEINVDKVGFLSIGQSRTFPHIINHHPPNMSPASPSKVIKDTSKRTNAPKGIFAQLVRVKQTGINSRPKSNVEKDSKSSPSNVDKFLKDSTGFFSQYSSRIKSARDSVDELSKSPGVGDSGAPESSLDLSDDSFDDIVGQNPITSSQELLQNERERKDFLIQKGMEAGYSTILDRRKLEKRSEKLLPELIEIFNGSKSSDFRQKAMDFSRSFDGPSIKSRHLVEAGKLPPLGYYGYRGQVLFSTVIKTKAISQLNVIWKQNSWMHKYDIDTLITIVLVPEMAVRVISQERSVSLEKALKILSESDSFGKLYYQDNSNIIDGLSESTSDIDSDVDDGLDLLDSD